MQEQFAVLLWAMLRSTVYFARKKGILLKQLAVGMLGVLGDELTPPPLNLIFNIIKAEHAFLPTELGCSSSLHAKTSPGLVADALVVTKLGRIVSPSPADL